MDPTTQTSSSAVSPQVMAGTSAVAKEQGKLEGEGATQYRIVDSDDKIGSLAWRDPKAESQGGYAASTLKEVYGSTEEAVKLSSLKAYDRDGKPLDLEGELPKPEEAGTKGVYKIPLRLVGEKDGNFVVIDRFIYLRTGKGEAPTQDEIKSTLWYETQQIRALNGKLPVQDGATAKDLDKDIFKLAIDNPTFQFTTKTVGVGKEEIKDEELKKYESEHKWVRLDLKDGSSQAKKAIGVQSVVENALFKSLLELPPKQDEVRTNVVGLLKQNEGQSKAKSELRKLNEEEKKNVLENQTKKATDGAKEFLENLKKVDQTKLKDDAETKKTLEKLLKEYDDVRGEIAAAHFIKDPDDSTKEVSPDLKKQEDELKTAIDQLKPKLQEVGVAPFPPVLSAPPPPLQPQQQPSVVTQPQQQGAKDKPQQQSSSVASSPATTAAAVSGPGKAGQTTTVQPQQQSAADKLQDAKDKQPQPQAQAQAQPQKQKPSDGQEKKQPYKRHSAAPAKPGANKGPVSKLKDLFH